MLELTKKTPVIFVYLALALGTITVFRQVRNFDFVTYDDNLYVSENQHVLHGLTQDGIIWAFTTCYLGYWQPLTWLSLMLDCQLFGTNAGWMHLVNLLLHLVNTLLLFAVFKKMTSSLWPSAFVAAAFAIHPMHVESVAWIAERKDVLSTFFLLLTLAAYTGYTKSPTVYRYMASLVLFAFGLMAKPMLVTLPFVLLLLDYWPLNRLMAQTAAAHDSRGGKSVPAADKRCLIEKIPFFVLSAVSSVITFLTQQAGGVIVDTKTIPLTDRVGNAFLSYAAYMGKMFWPQNLAVHYPFNAVGSITLGQFVSYALLLVVVSFLVLCFCRTRRYLLVGWFWFVGTLIPVIGLVQFTGSSYADRYTYIPYIGLFIMIAWGLPELLSKFPQRKIALGIVAAIVLTASGVCAYRQAGYWNNSITVFTHAIEVTQNNYVAHGNLGVAYNALGRYQDVLESYQQAIRIKPDYAEAHYNLGVAYGKLGRHQEAIESYQQAIRIKPDYAEAHCNLGVAYGALGRHQEAIEAYQQAIRIKPDYAEAHCNLGVAYGKLGRNKDAIESYNQAIRIKPDLVDAHYNLGVTYGKLGRHQDAIESFNQAIRLKPDEANAHYNLGNAYLETGDKSSALEEYEILKTLDAELANKLFNLIDAK